VGPLLAAAFKKKTTSLIVAFCDEHGLLQLPSFKMADDEIDDCYHTIIEKMRLARTV